VKGLTTVEKNSKPCAGSKSLGYAFSQTTQSIVIIISHGEDHVLNVDLRVN